MPRPPISGGNWPGRRPGVASRDVLPFIACAIIVCTAAWLVPPERAEPRAGEVEARLAAELDSRIGLLTAWQRDRRSSLEAIADAEELRTRVRQANDRAEIARHLARVCLGFEGCAVHASGGRLIADFQNRESPEELVLRAGTGRTSQGAWSRPTPWDVQSPRHGASGLASDGAFTSRRPSSTGVGWQRSSWAVRGPIDSSTHSCAAVGPDGPARHTWWHPRGIW